MFSTRHASISNLKHVKVITFDVFNTLCCTILPVMEQYSLVAKKHKIQVSAATLNNRFPDCFKTMKRKFPLYGKYDGLSSREWWGALIINLFEPKEIPTTMVTDILDRFEGKDAYSVYKDVLEFLEYLRREHKDIILGVITNTDPTARTLLHNMGIWEYFKDHIYLSYDIEVSKPDKRIFDYVYEDIINKNFRDIVTENEIPKKDSFWHIGDELGNDFMGTKKAGWSGILIDRNDTFGFYKIYYCEKRKNENIINPDIFDDDVEKVNNVHLNHNFQELTKKSQINSDIVPMGENHFIISNFSILQKLFEY